MKILLLTLSLLCSGVACAQNPIIHHQFTADPTARVFNDKVYLFPSHDIISPVEPQRKWFSMADYHVFSSDNLVDWHDYGVILSQKDVPWGKPDGYSMWAPDCVKKDGKYYLYFPDAPREGRGFCIGVAIADKPEGPYIPEREPIRGVMGIDPCVLQTSSGDNYLIWSGMGLYCAKLSSDMRSIISAPKRLDDTLPKGFKEGPFAFERDGKYYLTYPWVEDSTETLAYAMSDNPTGPYTYRGLIMCQSPVGCWTNHHSLVCFKGEWYLFYHHNDYSPDFDKNRSVRIDKVRFNDDGTIEQVLPTLRGVGITPCTSQIQLDRYSGICSIGTSIDFLDITDTFKGWYVRLSRPGTWVSYHQVNFPKPATCIELRIRTSGCLIAVTCGASREIARVEITSPAKNWTTLRFPLTDKNIIGIQNLRVDVLSGEASIDYITFPT
jgi:hypothetical protein